MAEFKSIKHITLGTYGPLNLIPYSLHHKRLKEHGHVIGASKSGKSRFLASLYIQLLQAGYSVTLVDPHGDLAKLILSQLLAMGFFDSPKAFDKLTYLDFPCAERLDLFMPFNVLSHSADPQQDRTPAQVASDIKDAFHRAWPELESGAAIFDTLMPDAVMLLYKNNHPLIALDTLLNDEKFRMELLEKETDYFLVQSFDSNYNDFKKVEQQMYAGSIKRRARQLTRIPILRYGLGQTKNFLNFRSIMDNNRSLLINLGGLDTDATGLIGCLLTTQAEQAALSRAALPADSRFTTHFLMVDEFSQFADQSEKGASRILSLTRKYGLYWIMAHQTWGQLSFRMRNAVQNAGYEVIFKTGPDDASISAPYVSTFDPEQIKHEIEDEEVAERTHPTFMALSEQRELAALSIRDLKRRRMYFRSADNKTTLLKTVNMPDPRVNKDQLAEIERHYLSTCFVPRADIEKQIYPFTWGRLEKKSSTVPAHEAYLERPDDHIDS